MSPCIVQQLFRLKIGVELDQSLIDEFIFPFLLKQKSPSQLLLQDIKLAGAGCWIVDKTGWHKERSIIVQQFEEEQEEDQDSYPVPSVDNIPQFTPVCVKTCDTRRLLPNLPPRADLLETCFLREGGKWTSNFRIHDIPPRYWGTIDIVNRLRSLKHPQVSQQLNSRRGPPHPEEEKWIYLEETWEGELRDMVWSDPDLPPASTSGKIEYSFAIEEKIILEDVTFVNDFLENILSSGRHLNWGCPSGELMDMSLTNVL